MIVPTRYYEFRGKFAEATDFNFWPIEWLDQQLFLGHAEIWFSEHASIIAGVKDYPGGARVIEGLVAAGPLEEILGLIAEAEVWGKSIGCTHAMISSREGWQKALKPKGFTLWQASMIKSLATGG